MGIRDLGYRPYDGDRLPPSRNTRVLFFDALRQTWKSWTLRAALFFCWVPAAIMGAAIVIARSAFTASTGKPETEYDPELPARVASLLDYQTWLFVLVVTLAIGSRSISRDHQVKAFQFYFSKPCLPWQYLAARVLAVALWLFILTAVPATMLVLAVTGLVEDPRLLTTLIPATIASLFISGSYAVGAVGASSLSTSRGLTTAYWAVLLLVPLVVGNIAASALDFPWLLLASLPFTISVVHESLFKIDPETAVHWYHAFPVLVCLLGMAMFWSHRRISLAEVVR